MSNIHPSAIIDPTAQIGEGVSIGPYAVIGPEVKLGDGVQIYPNAYVEHSEIGKNTMIANGAIVGTPPQDYRYKGEKSNVIIGENCQIREHATINRGTGENTSTVIGDNCILMIGSHVAHNCLIGNNVSLANLVSVAGHVTLEDHVFIGGTVVLHQFVRVGKMVIMGGFSGTRQDIPPFAKTDGRPAGIIGINTIGLKRCGLSLEERTNLKKAFNLIWFSDYNTQSALEKIKDEIPTNEHIEHLINFIQTSKRGVTKLRGKQGYEAG